VRKEDLVGEVAGTLAEADYQVSRVMPYGAYCFDIAARRDLILILKVLVNVDSMDAFQAEQLKRLCCLVSGYPLLIGDRTRTERIEDDVVHERYDLPAINSETLRSLLQSSSLPLIFGTKGGYYVRINGEALREERKRRGLSLGQLAERVGVTRESIYNYEHDGNATVETAMALVEELGADLVRPVEVLRKVDVNLRPDSHIENELLRFVASRLTRIGFGVYTTQRTPFHVIAEESRERLMSAVFEKYRNLRQHAEVISSLSRVIDITAFLVSHETGGKTDLRGIPIILEEELRDVENKSDLSGMIREKARS